MTWRAQLEVALDSGVSTMMRAAGCVLGVCMLGSCARQPLLAPTPPAIVQPSCQTAATMRPLSMLPTPLRVIPDKEGIYWIALDPAGYENLARNIESMRLALSEARVIIKYYRDCTGGEHGSQP